VTTCCVLAQISSGSCSTHPGAGQQLAVLDLIGGHHRAGRIEDHAAGAGGALIDGDDVLSVQCLEG
jgi:hypothetical protein